MLLNIIIFQIFLIVVCPSKKCYLFHVVKDVKCDHDIEIFLRYRQMSDDKPYSTNVICSNPSSNFYNLIPYLNVSNLVSVETLNLRICKFQKLYSTLGEMLPKVFHLNLKHTRLSNESFDKKTVKEEIEVKYDEDFPFLRMPKLKKIDLIQSSVSILVLKNDALSGNPYLTYVRIRSCWVHMLPDTLFGNSTNIQHIDFSYNKIRNVSNSLFTNLTKLQIISFRSNMIESIDL